MTWSWSGGGGSFESNVYTLALEDADAGKTLTVTARYTDPAFGNDIVTAKVTVGASAGPTFSSAAATVEVDENTPTPHLVGTYTATGGEGTLTYSVNIR